MSEDMKAIFKSAQDSAAKQLMPSDVISGKSASLYAKEDKQAPTKARKPLLVVRHYSEDEGATIKYEGGEIEIKGGREDAEDFVKYIHALLRKNEEE